MGFWSNFGKIFKIAAPIAAAPFTGGGSLAGLLGAAGSGLGAISQAQATNRGEQFGGQMDLERLLLERERQAQGLAIDREQEGRAGAQDAWRRLQMAQRTLSPSTRPSLSPYSTPVRQATDAERQGADAMTAEVLARLQGGNPIAAPAAREMAVDPKLLQPGLWERIAGYGSAGLGILGSLPQRRPAQPFAPQLSGSQGVSSSVPWWHSGR